MSQIDDNFDNVMIALENLMDELSREGKPKVYREVRDLYESLDAIRDAYVNVKGT